MDETRKRPALVERSRISQDGFLTQILTLAKIISALELQLSLCRFSVAPWGLSDQARHTKQRYCPQTSAQRFDSLRPHHASS